MTGHIVPIPFELVPDAAGKTALGLIVLQADETIETEFRRLFGGLDLALYHTRIPSAETVTPETLVRMEQEIAASAAMLPVSADLSVIGYGCTSGATIIGADRVAERVNSIRPGAAVTDPLTAVKAACRALGARRLAMITPYIVDVSAAMRDNLRQSGIDVPLLATFGQEEERVVARITSRSVLAAIEVAAEAPCDALFLSCTNLPTLDILEAAETSLGKPLITSNQALAWHMLRLAGLDDHCPGGGILFTKSLSV